VMDERGERLDLAPLCCRVQIRRARPVERAECGLHLDRDLRGVISYDPLGPGVPQQRYRRAPGVTRVGGEVELRQVIGAGERIAAAVLIWYPPAMIGDDWFSHAESDHALQSE